MRDVLEAVKLAEEVGLDFFGFGEHHTRSMPLSSPTSLVTGAAASTERIRLGTTVTVLSVVTASSATSAGSSSRTAVTAIGDGVDGVSVGDLVAGVIPGMALGPRNGTFTEYVALPATAVATVPSGVDAQKAAVIGLAGVAAHDALEALSLQAGETVLVSGATGGVGSIAVQLVANSGLRPLPLPAQAVTWW